MKQNFKNPLKNNILIVEMDSEYLHNSKLLSIFPYKAGGEIMQYISALETFVYVLVFRSVIS